MDASNLIGRTNVGLHDRKKDSPAPKESPSGLPRAIQNACRLASASSDSVEYIMIPSWNAKSTWCTYLWTAGGISARFASSIRALLLLLYPARMALAPGREDARAIRLSLAWSLAGYDVCRMRRRKWKGLSRLAHFRLGSQRSMLDLPSLSVPFFLYRNNRLDTLSSLIILALSSLFSPPPKHWQVSQYQAHFFFHTIVLLLDNWKRSPRTCYEPRSPRTCHIFSAFHVVIASVMQWW